MVHNVDVFKTNSANWRLRDFSHVRINKQRKQGGYLELPTFQAHQNCLKAIFKTTGKAPCLKKQDKMNEKRS